jgi:hypothetical protein
MSETDLLGAAICLHKCRVCGRVWKVYNCPAWIHDPDGSDLQGNYRLDYCEEHFEDRL